MKNIIKNQLEKLISDIEEISDPYQRAKARIKLINIDLDVEIGTEVSVSEDKKAIKKDSKKKDSKAEPKEVNLEDTTLIVEVDGENIDILTAYNLLVKFEGDEEEKKELAAAITQNSLEPIYEDINNNLDLVDNEDKLKLAYYLQTYGVEELNGFVNQLTDGQFEELGAFVNNENINGLITKIENAVEGE